MTREQSAAMNLEAVAVAVKPCAACGTKLYFVPTRNAIGLAAFEADGRDHLESDCGKERG